MRKLVVVVSVLASALCIIAVALSLGTTLANRPYPEVYVGTPGDFPPGTVRFFAENGIFVVSDEGGLFAVGGKCTHLGCPLAWDEKEKDFHCDCHGSRFDPEGRVTNPPARDPLPHYALSYNEGVGIVVDLSRWSTEPKDWKKEPFYLPLSEFK